MEIQPGKRPGKVKVRFDSSWEYNPVPDLSRQRHIIEFALVYRACSDFPKTITLRDSEVLELGKAIAEENAAYAEGKRIYTPPAEVAEMLKSIPGMIFDYFSQRLEALRPIVTPDNVPQ